MINKLKNAIEKRLASDLAIKENKARKEKESLKYFYDQIILELGSQIEELILAYNKELEVNFSKVKIYIKYGDSNYESLKKNHLPANNPIVIFLGDKDQIKVDEGRYNFQNKPWVTIFRTGSYCSIGYRHDGVIVEENQYFEQYCFNIESSIDVGHAQQEKDNFTFDINDLDEEKIIKESLNKFNSFINSFIEKGDLCNLIY